MKVSSKIYNRGHKLLGRLKVRFWHVFNFGTRFKEEVTPFQRTVAEHIEKYGFYKTSLDTLRISLPEPDFTNAQPKKRDYLLSTWGETAVYDKHNPFMALLEHESFLKVAGCYLGYQPILNTLQLDCAVKAKEPPQNIQLWHRDPNDKKILKIFIYLNDVGENNGAFKYLRYSRTKHKDYFSFKEYSIRNGDIDEEKYKEDIITFTGKRGTVIFADTSGLHCGGYVKEGERKMLTLGYVTRANNWKRNFKYT